MHIRKITSAMALTLLVATAPAAFAVKTNSVKRTAAAQNGGWSASERAQFDQQFARFDSNGDGLISRAEFPADPTLFNRLDLNRDGAITRAEVAQALPDRAALERQAQAYDRNGDGIITRDEFPGDAAAFDRLDRNRDGVLSEADRQGRGKGKGKANGNANGNAQMRFRGMDRNGDGVISRDEWRGNDQSFRNHDRNGDGVLSGDELRGKGKQ